MSWPLYSGGADDPEAPLGLEPLVDVLGLDSREGRPILMVLGGSARTLGNMNRTVMSVMAEMPAVKVIQADDDPGTIRRRTCRRRSRGG